MYLSFSNKKEILIINYLEYSLSCLKDNFYYDTQYDHDGDADTPVVPAIRGFGDLSYHSNANAQYTQEVARDFIADYDGIVYDRDHNRPLSKRGLEASKKMGRYLNKIHQIPEIVISSSARQ